jgi:hypothetical protein
MESEKLRHKNEAQEKGIGEVYPADAPGIWR